MQVPLARISDLVRCPPFNTIFKINAAVKDRIREDIELHGFDESKPINVWRQKNIVLDGNTRIEAAIEAGMEEVPIHYNDFRNEGEALEYAIHNQRDRRNMTEAEMVRAVLALHKAKSRGRSKKTSAKKENLAAEIDRENSPDFRGINLPSAKEAAEDAHRSEAASETAEVIGISRDKVEKILSIEEHADESTKDAIDKGEKSINRAYTETQEKRKAVKSGSTFNCTNDSIEWSSYTWNPVTGCLGPDGKGVCPYCYARDIALRFPEGYPKGFNPDLRENRLAAPQNTRLPDDPAKRYCFVCSMADLFGDWVPLDWINKVIDQVRAAPDWTFIFLTKNPKRLVDIDWPTNAWVGATVDMQSRVTVAVESLAKVKASVRFVSCEPLCEQLTFPSMPFEWLIIGGRSRSSQLPAEQPQWSWVEKLMWQAREHNIKIYFKPNLEVRPREKPETIPGMTA